MGLLGLAITQLLQDNPAPFKPQKHTRRVDQNHEELYCSHCDKIKPVAEFAKSKRKLGKQGIKEYYQSWCRSCNSDYQKQRVKGIY